MAAEPIAGVQIIASQIESLQPLRSQDGPRPPRFKSVEARLIILSPVASMAAVEQILVQTPLRIEKEIFRRKRLRSHAQRQPHIVIRNNCAPSACSAGASIDRETHF